MTDSFADLDDFETVREYVHGGRFKPTHAMHVLDALDRIENFQTNLLARVKELEHSLTDTGAVKLALEARVRELEAEVERLRSIIYRITAPTASQVEEDDRAEAFDEGRNLTAPGPCEGYPDLGLCSTSPDNYDNCTCKGKQHWR